MSKSEIKRITHLAPDLVKEIRDQALEEAANLVSWHKDCEHEGRCEYILAQAIRALKEAK